MRHLPLLVVLLGGAALFPLTTTFDRHRTPPPDVVEVLPPPALLQVVTFGHRAAAADLLELRATNFLMQWLGQMNRLRHDHITRLYDAILTLSPEDPGPYLRASIYFYSVADRPDLARAVLERGLRDVPAAHPQRARLFLERVSIDLLQVFGKPEAERLEVVRRVGEELLAAEGIPREFKLLGRHMAARGLTPLQALRFEEKQVWLPATEQGPEPLRAHARERLREARSAIIAQALDDAAQQFAALQGRPPADLDELRRFVRAGVVEHRRRQLKLPLYLETLDDRGFDDPLGVGFRLEGGRVTSPGVEAARRARQAAR